MPAYLLALVALGALFPLVLSACGGGGDGGSTATTKGSSGKSGAAAERGTTIRHFGHEATGAQARQAEAAVRGYLGARAAGEWARACSYFTNSGRRILARFGAGHGHTCATRLESVIKGLPAPQGVDLGKTDIFSVRTEGNRGYVFYSDAAGTEYAMPVERHGSEWNVLNITGTSLEAR